MNAERKTPGIAFWTTVILVIVLAYPLSAGPACWTSSRWGDGAVVTEVYRPLTRLLDTVDSDGVTNAFLRYSELFAVAGFGWKGLQIDDMQKTQWRWRHRL